jgi:S-adenosyl-L-methionine hydrolase (adenosine-forming)
MPPRRGEGNRDLRVSGGKPAGIRLITLLTDFGVADYFVGALKGAILSINPSVSIVDLSHEIPPQDVAAGAFTLMASYESFPSQTVHVAVVDPGVGSDRRPILVWAGNHFFVGPDNGIFSYIYERETGHKTFHLKNEKYFRLPVSATFHGRDIFAPVAAALSVGTEPAEFGPEINDEKRLPSLNLLKQTPGKIKGRIIHIDRFGNCITNITRSVLPLEMESRAKLQINGETIRSFRRFFSDSHDKSGGSEKLFGVWGSAGFLEIAAMNRSAAKRLRAKTGHNVILKIKDK